MRVYFAAAVTNESRSLPVLREIVRHLEELGHEVPTRHIVEPDARARDAHLTAAQLAERDLAWLASCKALVAEVSTPSHGVGVEVATALQQGLPVLLLHREGARVSRLLLGLSGSSVRAYRDAADAAVAVDEFLLST